MDSIRALGALIGLLGLSACGETSDDGANQHGSAATAGTTSGGGQGSGATGGTTSEPTEWEPVSLADWPWFVTGAGATSNMLDDEGAGLTLSFPADVERMQLSTHHHIDFVAHYDALTFEASANRPTTLLVAFTGLLESPADYWADLAAGSPWLAAPVEIGTAQQSHTVSFESLAAQGPGTPRPTYELMGATIWFLIEDASELELSLANITLE